MPRRSKGARLYLRAARPERSAQATWIIRDGAREISTGCGEGSLQEAEKRLSEYIAGKHQPRVSSTGDPAEVLIADVLGVYAREKAPTQADPVSIAGYIERLLDWWGDRNCAEIKRSTCQEYVAYRCAQPRRAAKYAEALKKRITPMGARRELEVLSAALGWWDREHPFTRKPLVTLPEKPESRRDALTRHQAARLLRAAMGWRWVAEQGSDKDGGELDRLAGHWVRLSGSGRANRAHLRRFLLLGFYTGTRPGVLPKLRWTESPSSAWVDLDAGIIYRRGKAEKDHRTKRRPLVRVPDRLLAHLRRWRAADEKLQARLRRAQADAGDTGPPITIDHVLHHGAAPLAGRIRRSFAACIKDAGLPSEITPHWMRHTAATWLMEADVSPWDAAGYLGMTTKTLEACYGHHRPGHQEGARRALR